MPRLRRLFQWLQRRSGAGVPATVDAELCGRGGKSNFFCSPLQKAVAARLWDCLPILHLVREVTHRLGGGGHTLAG